jgi:hypothetical protein
MKRIFYPENFFLFDMRGDFLYWFTLKSCQISNVLVCKFGQWQWLQGGQSYVHFCVHELRFPCSWISLILDRTLWLNGARPANTCIPPSFPWIKSLNQLIYRHNLPITQRKILRSRVWILLQGQGWRYWQRICLIHFSLSGYTPRSLPLTRGHLH